jgi:hypothetical protein
VPVTFSLHGGTLSDGSTETDRLGEAAIAYLAPVSGQGASQLTVEAIVGGQRIGRTLSIRYQEGPPCPIAPGAAYTAFCVTDLGPVAGSPPPGSAEASGDAVGGLDAGATVRPLGRSDFLGWSLDPTSGVRLDQGYDTGQDGTIYAYGTVDGEPHAFLLTPR